MQLESKHVHPAKVYIYEEMNHCRWSCPLLCYRQWWRAYVGRCSFTEMSAEDSYKTHNPEHTCFSMRTKIRSFFSEFCSKYRYRNLYVASM